MFLRRTPHPASRNPLAADTVPMPGEHERICIIHDGGLPALVACLMADDPESVVAWCPPIGSAWGEGEITPLHRRASEQQADLLGLGRVCFASERPLTSLLPAAPALEHTALMLAAASEAVGERCTRLIWPVQCGDDLRAMSAVAEKASLINRLLEIELHTIAGGSTELTIETPFADLSKTQVAELALDLDAPAHVCWWRLPSAAGIEIARQASTEWDNALRAAGRTLGFPFITAV